MVQNIPSEIILTYLKEKDQIFVDGADLKNNKQK